jgi:protein-S-isoprenylcysteine O-methyltransferase Ste14
MHSRLYVVAQFACLAALLVPGAGWPASPLSLPLLAAAAALGLWAVATNRPGNFNVRPDPRQGGVLIRHGPYRHVRHPMYLAVLLFGTGVAIGFADAWRWGVLALLAIVLHFKARFEERALLALHPDYADYMRRTPALIPLLRWP